MSKSNHPPASTTKAYTAMKARRFSLFLMTIGGCLAMIYALGIGTPVTTEFFRAIGATEFHFGLITGLPLVMLLMQFVGAAALNRARRRKPTFIVCLILCRLLYLPIAFLPFMLGPERPWLTIWIIVALLAVSSATHNFAVPFWFSWMADLIPRRIMNRVWGLRQMAMHVTWTVTYLFVTLALYNLDYPATVMFPALTLIAVAAGIVDILLFTRVIEPPNATLVGSHPFRDFLAPLRDVVYRRFVLFSCAWTFATMFAAAFMQLYVLEALDIELWKASLIWCIQGVGMALTSKMWGRLADRYGNRPVLRICVTFKPMIVVVFLFLTPENVVWLLPLAFFLDGMLNAGNLLATNGYMLSIAPRENRSMFIAAITGLAGICGGVSAMVSGWILSALGESWSASLWGRSWNAYHVVFVASILMRLLCQILAARIREPGSKSSRQLITAMMDEWPMWIVRFPVGLFRRRQQFDGTLERDS